MHFKAQEDAEDSNLRYTFQKFSAGQLTELIPKLLYTLQTITN